MKNPKTATTHEREMATDEAALHSLSTGEVLRQKGLCQLVVVRTAFAGVHVGWAARCEGQEIELLDARRIWRWSGAMTLHELSRTGIARESRVSEPVRQILLTSVIEILPVEDAAQESLTTSRWNQ